MAAQLIAAHKFFQSRPDTPSLGMLFVVGEEIGGDGMKAFASYVENVTFRAGIFGEPTEENLASGHKGSLGVTLNVGGKSAHSAYPWRGISAIDYLIDGMVALNGLETELPSSELLGNSTLNIGRIAGGLASNIVPDSANASISIRVAGGTPDEVTIQVENPLKAAMQPALEAGGTYHVTFEASPYGPIVLDTDVPDLEIAPVYHDTDIPSLPQVEKRYLLETGSIKVAHSPLEELTQVELVIMAEACGKIMHHLFSKL
jgi:acetylornithine deacetylase